MIAKPERVIKLSDDSFTQNLLRVLLTNPEDDQGDDYFLVLQKDGKYKLWRIDNERVFYAPEEEQKGWISTNRFLQVKSILYCLPQMQQIVLSRKILKRFARLEPQQLLQTWFQELTKENTYHAQLFTQHSEITHHFDHQDPGICLLGVPITTGLTQELFNRFYSIQQVIHSQKQQVKGVDCLVVIQPLFKEYYLEKFRAKPFPSDFFTVTNLVPEEASAETKKISDHSLALFKEITTGLYQPSPRGHSQSRVPSNQAITKTLRLTTPITAEIAWEILQGKQHSPTQQLEKLNELQGTKLHLIKESLLQQIPDSLNAFQRLAVKQQVQLIKEIENALENPNNPAVLTEAQQLWLLKAIVKTPFHELSLKHFKTVVTDQTLQPILEQAGPYLLKLELNDCNKLTDQILQRFPDLCPNLTHLYANRLLKITVISGNYLKLCTLELSGNEKMTSVTIKAPTLKSLKANGCTFLSTIQTGSLLLEEVELQNCNDLKEIGFSNLAEIYGNLKKVKLNHSKIDHTEFREKYPFLINLPLEEQNPEFVVYLDKRFSHYLAEKKLTVMALPPTITNQLNRVIKAKIEMINRLVPQIMESNQAQAGGANALGAIAKNFPLPIPWSHQAELLLLKLIEKTNAEIKIAAAGALVQLGKELKEVIEALVRASRDSDSDVRAAAAGTLGQVKVASKEVIQVLVRALGDKNWSVRAAAAGALVQLGKELKEVIEALVRALGDSDSGVRAAAAGALVELGKELKEVIEALVRALGDFRAAAAGTLGQLKLASKEVIEVLVRALGGFR